MRELLLWASGVLFLHLGLAAAEDFQLSDEQFLRVPPVGATQLRVLSPTLLELTLVTGAPASSPSARQWNFVSSQSQPRLPDAGQFVVLCGQKQLPVKSVGFKRRVIYAPLKPRDLRVGNCLYLHLAGSVEEDQKVEVTNPSQKL